MESHDSVDAFLRAYRGQSGCVLLDIDAAGEDGPTMLEQLASRAMLLPVIVLSHDPGVSQTVRLMQAGAAAVLEKPVDGSELDAALDRALRRDEEQREIRERREELVGRFGALTEGEREVLERLIAGKANKNIAADLQMGLRTVELRRAKILKKTGAKSLAELVRLAMIAHPDWLHHPPQT
ncbi:MAG: LuxR C-terminal-related transcriptional regulator [Planctomycetes bacterium]|nr:LuxR C-terminal-related transcriptional regulator [Planctomycetota bacterium]